MIPKDVLSARRKELETELLIASPQAMKEYLQVTASLFAMGAYLEDAVFEMMEFASIRTPREVAVTVLRKNGHTMLKEQIAQAAVNGGFRRGEKKNYWDVIGSITHDLNRAGNKIFRGDPDGPISLVEWDAKAEPANNS